ncbi:hypothetical protein V9T40_006131 [Parthenolecanium corni]|uniref:RNA-directed DNA polymerase n=1 Tax=Parthenolecanium corni TaxID=536013 RepID=A0AAN9TXQ4_9HEMI
MSNPVYQISPSVSPSIDGDTVRVNLSTTDEHSVAPSAEHHPDSALAANESDDERIASVHPMMTRNRTRDDPPASIWPMTGTPSNRRGRGRTPTRARGRGRGFSPRPGAGRGFTPSKNLQNIQAEVHRQEEPNQFEDADPTQQSILHPQLISQSNGSIDSVRNETSIPMGAHTESTVPHPQNAILDRNQYEPYIPPHHREEPRARFGNETRQENSGHQSGRGTRGTNFRGGANFRRYEIPDGNRNSTSRDRAHANEHERARQQPTFEQQMLTLISNVNASLQTLNTRVEALETVRVPPEPRVQFGPIPNPAESRRSSASPASHNFQPNHSSTQRLPGESSYARLPRMPRMNTYTFEAPAEDDEADDTTNTNRGRRTRERMWRSVFQHYAGDVNPESSFVLEELEVSNSVSDSITKAFLRKKNLESYRGDNDSRTICEFIREFDRAFPQMPDNRNRCDMLRAHIDEKSCKWTKQTFAMHLDYLALCLHLLKLYWRPQIRHQVYGQFIKEAYDERAKPTFEDYVSERYYQVLDTQMMSQAEIMMEFQHKCPPRLAMILTPDYFIDFPTLSSQLMLDAVLRNEKNRLRVFGHLQLTPYYSQNKPGYSQAAGRGSPTSIITEKKTFKKFARPANTVNAVEANADENNGYQSDVEDFIDYGGYELYFADVEEEEEIAEENNTAEAIEEKKVEGVQILKSTPTLTIPKWKDHEIIGDSAGLMFFKANPGETNFTTALRRTYDFQLLNESIELNNLRDKIRKVDRRINRKVLIILSGQELMLNPVKLTISETLRDLYFELFQHHSAIEIIMAKPMPLPETSEKYWTAFSVVNAAYYYTQQELPTPYQDKVLLLETYKTLGKIDPDKSKKANLYFVTKEGAPRITINEGSYQTVKKPDSEEEYITWSTSVIKRFNNLLTLELEARNKKEDTSQQSQSNPKIAEIAEPEAPSQASTVQEIGSPSSNAEEFEFLGTQYCINEIGNDVHSLCWSSEDEDDDLDRADAPIVANENDEIIVRPRLVEPRMITGFVGNTRANIFCDDGSIASFASKSFVEKVIRENQTMKVVQFSQKPQIYGLAEPGKNMKKIDTLVHLRIQLRNGNDHREFQLLAEMPEVFGHDIMFGRNTYDVLRIAYDYDTSEMTFGCKKFQDFRVAMRAPFLCSEIALPASGLLQDIEEILSGIVSADKIKRLLHELFHRFAKIFDVDNLGRCSMYTHDFNLNAERIKSFQPKIYPIPQCEQEKFREILKQWVARTTVRDSTARFRSPILMVKKKNGERRPCIDFRELNKALEVRGETVPNIAELKSRFHGAQHFSKLDFKEGFLQIPLGESSKQYTAFSFEGKIYEFNVTPYGTMQSSQSFIKALQAVFHDMEDFIAVYVDDVLVYSKTEEDHVRHLELVFDRIQEANMTLNPKKCDFFRTEVPYLGFIVSDEGIRADPERIQGLLNIPPPKDLRGMQSFLGLVNFYRDHIPGCAIICEPLHRLTHKDTPFAWGELQERSFEMLKSRIAQHILLTHPDFNKPFYVQTDASLYGIGGYVYQLTDENKPVIVAICSRLLNRAERNYGTYERELLALVHTIRKYYYMLLGHSIYLITDHQALVHLKGENNFKERLNRWRIELQNFNIVNICHVPGDKNIIADTLSRFHKDFIVDTKALYKTPSVNVIMRTHNGDYNLADVLAQLPQEQRCDPETKQHIELAQQNTFSRFRMREGVLEYKNRDGKFRTYVPERWRDYLINQYHLQSQHVGIVKTITILRRQFDWPGLSSDVCHAIRQCKECNLCKRRNLIPQGPQFNSVALEKNDYIAVDYFGPLPGARAGLSKILVVMDIFTKFVRLYPVKLMTTDATLKAMDKYVHEFGAPKRILSDNGRQFDNDRWRQYWQAKGTDTKFIAVYRPASNPCERVMATLGDMLRLYSRDKHRRWPNLIADIQNRINNLQRKPKMENIHELENATDEELFLGEERAKVNIKKAIAQRQAAHMKKHQRQFELSRGHVVYVRQHLLSDKAKGEAKKLFALFDGPYTVVESLGKNNYLLRHMSSGRYRSQHINNLKI